MIPIEIYRGFSSFKLKVHDSTFLLSDQPHVRAFFFDLRNHTSAVGEACPISPYVEGDLALSLNQPVYTYFLKFSPF